MTDDLDTLRPEVQEAMHRLENYLHITIDGKHFRSEDYDTIRAELLRLADENVRLEQFARSCISAGGESVFRATKAEGELAALKAEMDQLRADAETGKAWRTDNSLEEWFPMTAAELRHVKGELAALKARIDGSSVVKIANYGDPFIVLPDHLTVPNSLKGKTVRLVVEE